MQRSELVVGGILITLFSLGNEYDTGIFVLHGRQHSVQGFIDMNPGFIDQIVTKKHCVLMIEQRNHGSRLISEIQNHGIKNNPNHPKDMFATQYGTAMDIQFLMDTVPFYLNISQWGMLGFSLGGHATFLASSLDSRLLASVAVVGCGDYKSLMKLRNNVLSPELTRLVNEKDPIHNINAFANKHTLAIYGGQDTLVPYEANVEFEKKLHGAIENGTFESFVDPLAKHEFTNEMKSRAIEFLFRHLQ